MVVASTSESSPSATPTGVGGRARGRSILDRWLLWGCLALLSAPLLIALVGFRRHPWTPVLDLAMTELRVRDVGGPHTPLIGLPGRIGTLAEQGSHPGPLSFYALAPTYRLLGSTAWALQAATLVVHLVALGVALVIARRRGGRGLLLVIAVLLAVLLSGFGPGVLLEPWNPYLPLLWWVVVLLAVWSVLCGDLPMLPVAVLSASFCAQTHIPYLGLTLGLLALAVVVVGWTWRRDRSQRTSVTRWGAAAVALGLLLWIPPVLDQIRHEPGNAELIVDHFSHPPDSTQGLGVGVRAAIADFDLTYLVRGDLADPGSFVRDDSDHRPSTARGTVFMVLWLMTFVLAARRRLRPLLALHAVVAVSAILMAVSVSRIFGTLWYYLTLWGWAISLLGLVAAAWTVIHVIAEQLPVHRRSRVPVAAGAALGIVGTAILLAVSVAAWDSEHSDPTVAAELAAVIDEVAGRLDAHAGAATGRSGRYLVSWDDSFHIGSQGYGLLNELERRGYEVGVDFGRRVPATWHRVIDPGSVTARVLLATGGSVARWRATDGAVELAHLDPRTAAQRAEQARLRERVIAELERLGLPDLVAGVDQNLFGAAIDARVPEPLKIQMGRMLELGAPMSVFVLPSADRMPE